MHIDLRNGINQRLGAWRGQLWQIMEAQSGPVSPNALPSLLRSMTAYMYQAGMNGVANEISVLAAHLTGEDKIDRATIEEWADRIFLNIEVGIGEEFQVSDGLCCLIHIIPGSDFFTTSLDLSLVFHELEKLGELEIIPDLDKLPPLADLDPSLCHMGWHLILSTRREFEEVRDTLSFLESEPGMNFAIERDPGDTDIAKFRNSLDYLELQPTPAGKPDQAIDPSPANTPPVILGTRATDTEANNPQVERHGQETTTIRLSPQRLDRIIDAVGELVTAQVRLSRLAENQSDPQLIAVVEEIERLTIDLRDGSMGLRMVSVKSLFQRFTRLVRDLSQSLGKEVDFMTEGEETELDRTVIERLYDPLVHLIRNSLDHGLEPPAIRKHNGKSQRGCLILRASQQGSEVLIEVIDDGAGINLEKVRSKAIERALIREDSKLDERETLELIFHPGFSTSETVSGVSGRGVGMDVVKSNVEALRGHVEIDNTPGQGCIMILRFPLTMAIIDGLCVSVAGEQFILPIEPVEECLDLDRYDDGGHLAADFAAGRDLLKYNLRGRALPLCSLSSVLKPGSAPGHKIIVLRAPNGERLALTVDAIIGRQQVVVKPIGPLHATRRELSGATIMGDGSMALILDVPTVIRKLSQPSGKKPGQTLTSTLA